jgi:hypothetical protein
MIHWTSLALRMIECNLLVKQIFFCWSLVRYLHCCLARWETCLQVIVRQHLSSSTNCSRVYFSADRACSRVGIAPFLCHNPIYIIKRDNVNHPLSINTSSEHLWYLHLSKVYFQNQHDSVLVFWHGWLKRQIEKESRQLKLWQRKIARNAQLFTFDTISSQFDSIHSLNGIQSALWIIICDECKTRTQ